MYLCSAVGGAVGHNLQRSIPMWFKVAAPYNIVTVEKCFSIKANRDIRTLINVPSFYLESFFFQKKKM